MQLKTLAIEAATYLPELRSIRRDIHRRPELGLQLPQTLDRVLSSIDELDLEITRSQTISSAVVRIEGDPQGRRWCSAADLDGLALHEDTGLDFASRSRERCTPAGTTCTPQSALGRSAC